MKGFYQYLAPFAPDYSGAVGVLFGMGGLVVLCDPGGCSGNVCGYDEPRFYGGSQALYSAALRDMDTIFGKDDLLERKILLAASERDYRFIALVGTPVVSVIATDLKGLCRLLSRKTGLPVISVDTHGMDLYDRGAQKAWTALLNLMDRPRAAGGEPECVGVLGAAPLDMPSRLSLDAFRECVCAALPGAPVRFYGTLEPMDCVTRHVVVSPSGLKAARAMRDRWGIPYSVSFPMNPEFGRVLKELDRIGAAPEKILVVHQQVLADGLRRHILARGGSSVEVGSWFIMDGELTVPGDLSFSDEDEFVETAEKGGYGLIIADPLMRRALKNFKGRFIDLPHFAVSGDLFSW